MIRARRVTKGLLRGGAVVDKHELVIWLVPSLHMAIHYPDFNQTILTHCFAPQHVEGIRRIDDDEL